MADGLPFCAYKPVKGRKPNRRLTETERLARVNAIMEMIDVEKKSAYQAGRELGIDPSWVMKIYRKECEAPRGKG